MLRAVLLCGGGLLWCELAFQAQATSPAPLSCAAWCPKLTCCSTCDVPACAACGLTRDCSGVGEAQTTSPKSERAPMSFRTGEDGHLYADGTPFIVKGINWWGLEGPSRAPGGVAMRELDELLDFVSEQGFNAIRTLVNHHAVIVNGKLAEGSFDEGRNPALINTRYLEALDVWIRGAATRGLLVMVNVHRTMAEAWPGEGLWYDSRVSEAEAIASWKKLARSLCKHWNVFAADLVNEPVKASWGRGGANDWNKAAERLGNAVLAECPRLLIFVQGVGGKPGAPGDGGESQGYFWGENLVGVKAAPVRLNDMSKLVYSPHTYGPGVFRDQPYFPTCQGAGCVSQSPPFPANMPAIWDRHFGSVAEESKQAVVVGEASQLPRTPQPPGHALQTRLVRMRRLNAHSTYLALSLHAILASFGGFYVGADKEWQDAFVDYLIARGFGSFYFGLNPDSDDTGGLLHKDWRTPVSAKLKLLSRLPATPVHSIGSSSIASPPRRRNPCPYRHLQSSATLS
ncbi:MAG: hypothetical protein SGPRY_013239 [Prymnesium sp.]